MKLIYLIVTPLCFLMAAMLSNKEANTHLDPIEAAIGELRSPHWPKVRDEFLKTHPTCAVCGCKATSNFPRARKREPGRMLLLFIKPKGKMDK